MQFFPFIHDINFFMRDKCCIIDTLALIGFYFLLFLSLWLGYHSLLRLLRRNLSFLLSIAIILLLLFTFFAKTAKHKDYIINIQNIYVNIFRLIQLHITSRLNNCRTISKIINSFETCNYGYIEQLSFVLFSNNRNSLLLFEVHDQKN